MTMPCDECGKPWPLAKIDAKPGPGRFTPKQLRRAANRGGDFTRFEGPCCYGPGYLEGSQ
jgi:hypothetical protein